jgi:hypothetical protein
MEGTDQSGELLGMAIGNEVSLFRVFGLLRVETI